MSELNRRTFLSAAAGTVATASLAGRASAEGPNDTVRAAVLGVNSRGKAHIEGFTGTKGVKVAVLCDPDQSVLNERLNEFEKKHGYRPDAETDLRKVYDRKDVDVVSVATPNHWHALATIWACQAGKDVYVEKPGSHNIFEGRKMVEAAKKYGRIVQHGVQLRSSEAIQEAVDHLRKGVIGKVYMARGLVYRDRASIGQAKDPDSAPTTLNWDLWQGPAQERAFSKRIVHYNWHWHWNYGNGDVGNQGVHETDMCLWGLGLETLPSSIVAMGGKFLWDDDKETPELLSSSYMFPEQNQMIEFEVRPWATNTEGGAGVGNIFYGSDGYLVVKNYSTYETFLGRTGKEPGPKGKDGDPVGKHFANFIAAVRSRDPKILHGPVETAHISSGLAHLGNIAYRVGRRLNFDPVTEKFIGDSEADALLTRNYRQPYVVPDQV
ncbi:Gfo/Idh/MocA family oxidoreductase [Singulisphaera acidiphila]|uniref:Putative dehydrogenase n=1 Tax=Singulisphaera acidiphila (strain ATCC BAA-1392 / DSM 18658 / VKM B-2454 / MOB10) TaxID=886293 RepID=L0DEJ9_SINAD|nr:Gfo/Idh/MocA family oxidoreductase [Singulisphaera acidiphila]AGA27086.1 putative dehydrogenase [Singulisphaera acidiphila DSM 18658]